MNKDIEELIVKSFFIKQKRERGIYEFSSSKKRRSFIWKLSKDIMIDTKIHKVSNRLTAYIDIEEILLNMGAPKDCYVMSIDNEIDGQVLSLNLALSKTIGFGPAFISCVHGKLAYLECEQSFGPPERFILY